VLLWAPMNSGIIISMAISVLEIRTTRVDLVEVTVIHMDMAHLMDMVTTIIINKIKLFQI